MGTHTKAGELKYLMPTAKLAYSLADIEEMGLMSRTQAYNENREGRLVLRKAGRKTFVLHEDLMRWLGNLPLKNPISEPHQERALRRWHGHRKETW